MGVADLRTAFNAAAPAGYSCNLATLRYERVDGGEVAILRFRGSGPDGAFDVESAPVPPIGDVNAAARAAALALPLPVPDEPAPAPGPHFPP